MSNKNIHFEVQKLNKRTHKTESRCACGGSFPCEVRDAIFSHDPEATVKNDFMVGQRVIYGGVICVVCRAGRVNFSIDLLKSMWIDNPEQNMKMIVEISKVQPLPNGQL